MTMSFSIGGLREAYWSRRVTPLAVAEEALKRIAAYSDPAVWITKLSEEAVLSRARSLTQDPGGVERLPLYGIPFAVKDNIDCAGIATTAACPEFGYEARRDAFAVARLIEAGAILMGKTNLDQFATGLVGTRSPYGIPHCVFDAHYVSGGSSSGSAVAVAAELVSFALGTDTAGSGRVPAAYNNIVGLKPTRGLVSTTGVVPACRTLDCVSVFSGTVGDAVDVLNVMQGRDGNDPYSRTVPPNPIATEEFRFGVLAPRQREFFGDIEMANLYDAAIMRMVAVGGTPVEVDYAPFAQAGALLYDGPWVAERYAALEDFMRTNLGDMDPTVRAIVTRASNYSAAQAFNSEYRRMALQRAVEAVWGRIGVLLLPTVPGHDSIEDVLSDPIGRNARLGMFTNFVNLLDCCAVAVPAYFRENGLPFGITLVAPAFSDPGLAIIASRFHRSGNAGYGISRAAIPPNETITAPSPEKKSIPIFVVGAHLSGMPLNTQLQDLGAEFLGERATAPDYRLYALPDADPLKPGMMRSPGFDGPGILGEVWNLTPESFGNFVAKIPSPLGIGKISLSDGTVVSGFLCEPHALTEAEEITDYGGWRKYLALRHVPRSRVAH